jgi:hypothetical protein
VQIAVSSPGCHVRVLLAVLFAVSGLSGCETFAEEPPAAPSVRQLLEEADAAYWLAIAEAGNPEVLRAGLNRLDDARASVESAGGGLSTAAEEALERDIESLSIALENQLLLARDTLVGVFPLVRFSGSSLFRDPASATTFELVDDPEVTAAVAATRDLVAALTAGWATRPHQDVIVLSVPYRPDLEGEARYVLSRDPRFYLHHEGEVARIAGSAVQPPFESATVADLLDGLDLRDVVVVTLVQRRPLYRGDAFIDLRADVWARGVMEPVHTAHAMGFARDRRSALLPLLALQFVLLVGAIGVGIWRRIEPVCSWGRAALVLVGAFTVGRLAPWLVAPVVLSISPPVETLVHTSFWVPPTLLAAALGLPVVTVALVARRVERYVPYLRGVVAPEAWGAGVGLGVGGWLATGLFLWHGPAALIPAVLVAVAGGALGATTASAISPRGTVPPLALLYTMPAMGAVGLTWASGVPVAIGGGLIAALACFALARSRVGRRLLRKPPVRREFAPGPEVPALAHRLVHPPLVHTTVYDELLSAMEAEPGAARCVLLTGPEGVGKSRLVEAVLSGLERADVSVLCGHCRDSEEPVPYDAVQDLFLDAGLPALAFLGRESAPLGAALDGLADSLLQMVPFAAQLGNPVATALPRRPEEIRASLCAALSRHAGRRRLVLVLDDIQWLDPASADLVFHLLERYGRGDLPGLCILLVGRPSDATDRMREGGDSIELRMRPPPLTLLSAQIMAAIGLRTEDAARVAQWTWDGHDVPTLGTALRLAENLARSGWLVPTERGPRLVGKLGDLAELPVPANAKEEARELVNAHGASRDLIGIAACLGFEFRVGVLAEALGQPRLSAVSALDALEAATGIVRDARRVDGLFRFRDKISLSAIRELMELAPREPDEECPQIVREYHLRVARALSQSDDGNPLRVAAHYRAAGREFGIEALPCQLLASQVAAGHHQFDLARSLLDRGRALDSGGDHAAELDRLALQLLCEEAHVRNDADLRRRALRCVEEELRGDASASASLLSLAARTAYDAGDYSRTLEIVESMDSVGGAEFARLEGQHLAGLALDLLGESKAAVDRLRAVEGRLRGVEGTAATGLRSRVLNSLAEVLTWTGEAGRAEATECFKTSLELKGSGSEVDLPGLARAHGGLARLELVAAPEPDLDRGRFHAKANIEICRDLGDRRGEAQMVSLLARAALVEGALDDAHSRYHEAIALAPEYEMNVAFCTVGLLRCAVEMGSVEAVAQAVEAVLDRLKNTVFSASALEELRDVVGAVGELSDQMAPLIEVIRVEES